jgi:hypothetical protein
MTFHTETRGDRNAPHATPVTPDEDVRTILESHGEQSSPVSPWRWSFS